MANTARTHESTAEREGIVDQQDAVLEQIEAADEQLDDELPDEPDEPGGDIDPMAGEAPTG